MKIAFYILLIAATLGAADLEDFIKKTLCEECARLDYLEEIYDETTKEDPVVTLIRSKTEHFTPTDETSWKADFNNLPVKWIMEHSNASVDHFKDKGVTFLKKWTLCSFYDLCLNAWIEKAQVLYDSKTESVTLLLVFREPIVEVEYKDGFTGKWFVGRSHGIRILNPTELNYSFEIWMDDPALKVRRKLP